MRDTVEVGLTDLLDLINAAHLYGYDTPICIDTLIEWAGPVTAPEIEQWIETCLPLDKGYTVEEDHAECRERLYKIFNVTK